MTATYISAIKTSGRPLESGRTPNTRELTLLPTETRPNFVSAHANAYGNRFFVPRDFELLEFDMPFHQAALGDRLEYELTFNDYSRVIAANSDSSYTIDNICLEFDKVTNENLARNIRNQYGRSLAILYDRVLRHRKITYNKSDTLWNINLNVPARSMKGVLMLFEDPAAAYKRDPEAFYNPQLTKVEVTIEGIPNQLYSQGLRAYQQWDEARKLYAGGPKRSPVTGAVAKDLALADVTLGEYFTSWTCGRVMTISSTATGVA